MTNALQRDGLSIDLLCKLSYHSSLGISLKKNLHYFSMNDLFDEIASVNQWYDNNNTLLSLSLDYRIKSVQSAIMKYHRYYPDHQARKVFDDLLGLRSLVDDYGEILALSAIPEFRVADLTSGKAQDDGYRGVHIYFQLDNHHYPIEIQYNTYYDRQFNNWLHKFIYKKDYPSHIGHFLRTRYESGEIQSENDFREVFSHVLSDCQKSG